MALVRRGDIYHAAIYSRITKKVEWVTTETSNKKEAEEIERELKKKGKSPGNPWKQFRDKYIDYCKTNIPTWKMNVTATTSFSSHIHFRDIKDVTVEMIEAWKSELIDKGKTPGTFNRYLVVIDTMFQKAIEWKYIKENPCDSVDPIKIPEIFKEAYSAEEIEAIRQSAQGDLQKIFVELAFLTGGRRKEMQNLQVSDILLNRDLIRIGASKNGEIRYIPLHENLKPVIIKWLKSCPGPYVLSETGKKTNIWAHSRRFRAILKRAFKDLLKRPIKGSLHLCRHSWVTYTLLAGVNPKLVQKWAGHKDFRTTDRVYTHIMDDAGKEQINLLKI